MPSKKIACIGKDCVACGNCKKSCPRNAIIIAGGIRAVVDIGRCVGCGKCAISCPADVIELIEREAKVHEKAVV